MIYIISMLLWRHNSILICFQLYPEVDKATQKNEYMYIYIFETKHFINFVQWSIIFSAQHTFVIIFNSYNQLYNMQYPKVRNMTPGVYLRYLVNLYMC